MGGSKLKRLALVMVCIVFSLVAACGDDQTSATRGKKAVLENPVGFTVQGGTFVEIIHAGPLPQTFSEVLPSDQDNLPSTEVTIVQKVGGGIRTVATESADDLPPRPAGELSLALTVDITAQKELYITFTVSESDYVREFGPYSVE